MNYNELMSWYNEHYLEIYGFEPKSFWEFTKNNYFDKQIDDEIATKTIKKDLQDKKNNPHYHQDFGARTSFSKFNSEYARRLIEFYTCKGDKILDPFSGRTRKTICEILGREYTGFEINPKYCQKEVINDDCINVAKYIKGEYDCLFTCPPYWNLEVYSKDIKGDLSLCKTYDEFINEYFKRLSINLKYIKNTGLVIIVIADYREKNKLIPLHYDTIKILEKNQWQLYDEIILEMSPVARHCYYSQAVTKRRMLTTHEYVLIFSKPECNIEERKQKEDFNIINNKKVLF